MHLKFKVLILMLSCSVVASCSSASCNKSYAYEVKSAQTEEYDMFNFDGAEDQLDNVEDPLHDWRMMQQDRVEKMMNGEPDICDSDPENPICEWVLIPSH